MGDLVAKQLLGLELVEPGHLAWLELEAAELAVPVAVDLVAGQAVLAELAEPAGLVEPAELAVLGKQAGQSGCAVLADPVVGRYSGTDLADKEFQRKRLGHRKQELQLEYNLER